MMFFPVSSRSSSHKPLLNRWRFQCLSKTYCHKQLSFLSLNEHLEDPLPQTAKLQEEEEEEEEEEEDSSVVADTNEEEEGDDDDPSFDGDEVSQSVDSDDIVSNADGWIFHSRRNRVKEHGTVHCEMLHIRKKVHSIKITVKRG
ncbi:hypothetical protein F2Q69_00049683 [Brassica cretica]|uniref:Uncharacterized protein n=1 Tax=Brassica cretica TaxID=69181 RepID=A0A8S9PX40_BRACR|nr:hypothetical protein F2Q69_00049683 [Brassica cretica]